MLTASQRARTQTGAFILALCLCTTGLLQAALPQFNAMAPRGVQRGVDTPVVLSGARLEDFEGIIFFTPGISMKSVGKVEGAKVEVVLSVAPEVTLGNHMIRLRTRTGISNLRQIFVGPYPNVAEKEPNNDFESPQEVGFNQTVEGVATAEDVDYYKIKATKGQRISLEIEGMRLGYTVFDPFVSLLNKDRFEIASSDDTVLHRQDGYLSVLAPEDGDYVIQVRESSYRGSPTSYYRLHIGSFRRPDVCYPSGGKVGSTLKVKFIENSGEFTEEDVTLPGTPSARNMVYLKSDPAPSGNVFRSSPFENYLEVEPNDKEPNLTNLEAPCALNGIIEKEEDQDRFMIKLKKGSKVDIFAYAQTVGSPLDPVISVANAKGAQLGASDDGGASRRLDCKLSITAPEDGDYSVTIRDHLMRGGANFIYRIEAMAAVPDVSFSSPNFAVNDSHKRQFIAVPRGSRYATLVNVTRNNVSGEMKFVMPDLPAGMKLLTTTIPGNQTAFPLLFEAAPDAPLGGGAVPIKLLPTDPAAPQVQGDLAQVFDMVRQGNTIYYTEEVDKLPVAVIEETPYTLELIKPAVPIVTNGALDIKVVAKRKEGFKAKIRVQMVWRPPGLNCQGEIDIPEGQNEGVFNFDSKPDVAVGSYPLTVLGEVEVDGAVIYSASPYCEITVAPAHFTGAIPLTVVEQGKEGVFVCKFEHTLPFEGEASAQVYGVPAGVTVEPVKITKDTKEATFKFKTEAATPVSKTTNLFCQVEVPVPGGTTAHRIAGGTTLRVDAPRKAPAAEPAKPAEPAVAAAPAAAPPAPKVLSRLEQLRLEQASK